MKIFDIMRPFSGNPENKSEVKAEMSLYQLASSGLKDMTDTICAIREDGKAVGEVRKKDLEYLISKHRQHFSEVVMDYIPIGIIAADCNGRIFYVNPAYTSLLGVAPNRIIGRNINKIEPDSYLSKALHNHQNYDKETHYIKSVDRFVSLHIEGIFENNQYSVAISFFTDDTQIHTLHREIERMSNMVSEVQHQYEETFHRTGLITQDPGYNRLIEQAAIVAKTDVPILIRGENGVGKEVLAKYIHKNSNRSKEPLIIVNCAAIPETLIESELFGYEEGAFTGASKGGKMGKFELANHGTIFLDEIGDMPVSMQSKLLRVIQEGEIEKIGRQQRIPVDVRIIAATNQPLENLIRIKLFREDLFFRLNVITLNIVPLRKRPGDIPLLAEHFLKKFSIKYNRNLSISKDCYVKLMSYSWPGNIRELRNIMERSVILSGGKNLELMGVIGESADEKEREESWEKAGSFESEISERTISGLSLQGGIGKSEEVSLADAVSYYEATLIRKRLKQMKGNRESTIKSLGISRRTFYRKCAEYKIK